MFTVPYIDKKNFEHFSNSVGMNVSTAMGLFIKAILYEQKLYLR